MKTNLAEQVTQFIGNGETKRALEVTRDYLAKNKQFNKAYHHSVVMLLGKYNKFEKERRLGLEPEAKRLNQIEYNLLNIVDDIKAGNTNPVRTGTQNSTAARGVPSKSGSSPVLWIFATIGVIFILLMVIGLGMEDDPEKPEGFVTTVPTDTEVEPEYTYTPPAQEPVPAEATENFTAVTDNVISNLLGGTTWYTNFANIGYIVFDQKGKTATYANGYGNIELTGMGTDGYMYASYLAPDGTYGVLAFVPQMNNYTLSVYTQSQFDAAFSPNPMIWAKQ